VGFRGGPPAAARARADRAGSVACSHPAGVGGGALAVRASRGAVFVGVTGRPMDADRELVATRGAP